MAIYHRDEYASVADWALDEMCQYSVSGQMRMIERFLERMYSGEEPLVSMLCFLDLPNAKEKFEQFLIKEAECHG